MDFHWCCLLLILCMLFDYYFVLCVVCVVETGCVLVCGIVC